MLLIIILSFIGLFISVIKKDRTEEVDRIYRLEHANSINQTEKYEKTKVNVSKKVAFDFPEERYYCERCFKEISQEEYELYDCMCEECFEEIHYDFDGNPREDYWNY